MEIVVPEEFKHLYVTNPDRPIVKIPHPALRKSAEPVVKFTKKLGYLIDDLMRIMRSANGVGLAATQLGILERVAVIAPSGERAVALVNPEIVSMSGEQIGEEGCLSIPGLYGDVKRSLNIEVRAYDRKGRCYLYELEGMPARIAQHEIDHLDGVLFIDKVDPTTLHWMDPAKAAAAE